MDLDTKCSICQKLLTCLEDLAGHVMIDHSEEAVIEEDLVVEDYECQVCDRKFKSLDQLTIHTMVTHPNIGAKKTFRLRWIPGYNKTDENPGILVVNEAAKFALNKTTTKGEIMHYHCIKKSTTKCKAKCTIRVENGETAKRIYKLDKFEEINEHNHVIDEADIIALDMITEMHREFRKDLTEKPSVVRKRIMKQYRNKSMDDETWKKVMDVLPDENSIDRGIARVREQVWGKLPLNREDLDYKKVLESEECGKLVDVLDSNEMWKEHAFRDQVLQAGLLPEGDEEVGLEDDIPPLNPLKSVIIFTSSLQLELFELCSKGSVDGNFKIAPTNYSQVFVFMLKYGEKWVPVSFALLPSKEESSYKLFFNMMKYELKKRNIPCNVNKMIVDFEIGIQVAAISVWENLIILGCYFHFGQCIMRRVQKDKNDKEIGKFVIKCGALPFVRLNDLQETVDHLREDKMVDEGQNDFKDSFLNYIQSEWIDEKFPPHTWNCNGRNNENTNNNIERYNGILNRLIQVQHPNPYVLICHFVTEISSAITTIENVRNGKKLKIKRTKYINLGLERDDLRERYNKGLIARDYFLLRMGYKLLKLKQEAKRGREVEVFVDPNGDDDDEVFEENVDDASFGSFEEDIHPYTDRQVGVTKRGRKSKENSENKVKNKKCPKCSKKFVNGKVRKSKYLECLSCDRLTHERCANTRMSPFKCIVCRPQESEDFNSSRQSDINENIGDEENHSYDDLRKTFEDLDDVVGTSDAEIMTEDSEGEFFSGNPWTSSVNGTYGRKSIVSYSDTTSSDMDLDESGEVIRTKRKRFSSKLATDSDSSSEIALPRKRRNSNLDTSSEPSASLLNLDSILKPPSNETIRRDENEAEECQRLKSVYVAYKQRKEEEERNESLEARKRKLL